MRRESGERFTPEVGVLPEDYIERGQSGIRHIETPAEGRHSCFISLVLCLGKSR